MGDNPCTVGALMTAFTSTEPPAKACPNPVLQVLQVKPLAPQPNGTERYRVVLSDTVHFIQAMISTQQNALIQEEKIVRGCFIKLTNYNAQKVKEKKILILVDVEVLEDLGVKEKIGNPTGFENASAGQQQPAPPAQQAAASATSFYGNRPAQSSALVRGGGGGGAARSAAGSSTHANVYPIEAISPYQNKWTIKARVVNKSEIKTWSNQRSEGKLFTVTFLDETGEIRATGFNQECDKFFEVLQEGQVYYVSKCRVQMAKKQWSNVNNDYELAFGRDTEIELCNDDSVPKVNFNFVSLAGLEHVDMDAVIDVLGVVKEVGPLTEIISKATQKTHSKREISIVDSSNSWVRCTIWGKNAESWDISPDTVIALKGVKVSDFGGRSLSMTFGSSITVNPDIDEAYSLKGWYDGQGPRELSSYNSHAGLATLGGAQGRKNPVKTLQQIQDEHLGMNDDPDYFDCKATIVYIKHDNISYPACLSEGCSKKVLCMDDDSWRCEKCSITHPKPQYRYIMTISVEDAFGQAWFNCFDDVGKTIMGKSADELHEIKQKSEEEGNNKMYDACFTEPLAKTFIFKCRAKQDTFNDQTRVRYQVLSAAPVNWTAESNKLAEQIKLYSL